MIITKIELENITSHKKTVIEFQKGLNFLLGKNGSGKSTILNMIGYNLFDFIPGSQKSFLRDEYKKKTKYGLIKVWIVGLNDDIFIVERTLGRQSNVIEIKDARTGVVLPGVTNKESLLTWLKNQISLKEEYDLGDLFRTSIGVPQGTYTEPFLRAPQKRKDFFDPILKVDIYREVWKKLYEIIKYYNEYTHELELADSKLTAKLEQKGELDDEKKTEEGEIEEISKKMSQSQKKFDEIKERFDKFSSLKEALEKTVQKCELLEAEYKNVTANVNKLEEDLKEAETADENCKKTEDDYLIYEKLQINEENLRKLNDTLQRRKEERNDLRGQLGDLENRVEFLTEQIQAINLHEKELSDLEQIHDLFELLQKEIEEQRNIISKISAFEEQMGEISKIYTDLNLIIDEKKAKLRVLPEFSEIFNKLKGQLGNIVTELQGKIKGKKEEEAKLTQLATKMMSITEKIRRFHFLSEEKATRLPVLLKEHEEKKELTTPFISKLEPIEKMIKELEDVPEQLTKVLEEQKKTRENHNIYQSFEKLAKKLPALRTQLNESNVKLEKVKKDLEAETSNRKRLRSQYSEQDYLKLDEEKNKLNDQILGFKGKVEAAQKRIKDIDEKIADLGKKEKELEQVQADVKNINTLKLFTETIRNWFQEAGPKITDALISRINSMASDLYQDLMETDNVQLIWEQDYNIKIATPTNVKDFQQLSGGEQMSAALAIRLAILKILTNADFAFFDEPTTNLDKDKRTNLAKAIQNIKGFKQLFVISHDDTFEENAENIIKFTKDENEITHVQYLS